MNSVIRLPGSKCLSLSFIFKPQLGSVHNEWVSAPRQAQRRETNTKVGLLGSHTMHTVIARRETNHVVFCLFFFFNPCPDACNDSVFVQVWHLVTAQDLQLLPWREKLPAEDSWGETTNRRQTKILQTVYSCCAMRLTVSGYRPRCSINLATHINKTGRS